MTSQEQELLTRLEEIEANARREYLIWKGAADWGRRMQSMATYAVAASALLSARASLSKGEE